MLIATIIAAVVSAIGVVVLIGDNTEIILNLNRIMKTQAELAVELQAVTDRVAKVGAEVVKTLDKVSDLETALSEAGSITPEVEAAFEALKAQVVVVDDLIPDVEEGEAPAE
jgi:hypothetical protein